MTGLFGAARSTVQGNHSYANPHYTIALRDIPTNLTHVMKLCRYYYMTDSLLRAIVDKMSEYPITPLVLSSKGDEQLPDEGRERWERLLNVNMNMRAVNFEANVDKYMCGKSARFLYLPFVRYCVLDNGKSYPMASIRGLQVHPVTKKDSFHLVASGYTPFDGYRQRRTMQVEDRRSTAATNVRLLRLNPLSLSLNYNPSSGQEIWYWDPPQRLKAGLHEGDRAILESTEMRVLEAAERDSKIRFNPARLHVSQAPGVPGIWEGHGAPPLFPVLEDVYYHKILRRANEALAQEHVAPMRVVSPGMAGDVSPHRTLNLANWQKQVRREIMRFRRDPNHIMISPVPINTDQMGGQARVMMVASEMEAAARVIAAGVGCPIEMIWGGLNWSGASVSLRVLENHFLNDRENAKRLVDFFVPKLQNHCRLPAIDVDFSEFKMADDVQQQSNAINLMLQGYLDRESVLGDSGYDPEQVFDRMVREHERLNEVTMKDNIAAAHMNSVVQMMESKAQILMKYELQAVEELAQARAQRVHMENVAQYAAQLREKGLATPAELEHVTYVVQGMPPALRERMLANWSSTMPLVTQMIQERLGMEGFQGTDATAALQQQQLPPGLEGAQSAGAAEDQGFQPAQGPYGDGSSDPGLGSPADPLPDQLPPRRDNSPV